MNNDKSKCSNTDCILKVDCKRFTYISNSPNQSYTKFEPINGICDKQINNK